MKTVNWMRVLAALMAMLMLFCCLTACGGNEADQSSSSADVSDVSDEENEDNGKDNAGNKKPGNKTTTANKKTNKKTTTKKETGKTTAGGNNTGNGGNAGSSSNDNPFIEDSKGWKQSKFLISTFKGMQHNTGDPNDSFRPAQEHYDSSAKLHKEAGFDLMENAIMSRQEGLMAADACESAGIDFLIQNITSDLGFSGMGKSFPNFTEDTIAYVADELSDYDHLYGYYTWDEVYTPHFDKCRELNDLFKKHDPKKLAYSIVIPSYGEYAWSSDNWDNSAYANYVRQYVNTVDPDVLSFDYYPFSVHGGDETNLAVCTMWKDMGLFRQLSMETGKPFWFYFQAYNMGGNYTFTNAMRSAQMYGALAYGAKCLSYYVTNGTLVTKTGAKGSDFNDIKSLNKTVKNLGNFLFDKQSEEIFHFGLDTDTQNQYYLDRTNLSDVVKNGPDGSIVSVFRDKTNKKYVLVVNKDYKQSLNGTLTLKTNKKVTRYQHSNDTKSVVANSTAAIGLNIPAGECALFILE